MIRKSITDPRIPPKFWFLAFGSPEETCSEAVRRRGGLKPEDARPVVLIADDEPLIRQTMVEILRREGFDAVGVKDGMEAVECAPHLKPAIFLADVSMPRLNGIEAAKVIRGVLPSTRIICFSGHASTSALLEEAREQGADFEFLAKPIKPEILVRTLNGDNN